MAALAPASVGDLACEWTGRLGAETECFQAQDLYGGRGFQEAVAAAALLDARLMVVSAGLGLIYASVKVPPYACTILIDAVDSVAARVVGSFSSPDWWSALNGSSPFAVSLHEAVATSSGPVFAALSDGYIEMISDDLLSLPPNSLLRLRLFTRAPLERVPHGLRPFVMPYDDRLDGPDSPVPGTRSDFAGRALRHFAGAIVRDGDARSAAEHAAATSAAIQHWQMPKTIKRVRHDDAAILGLLRLHWDDGAGRSLRRFRDELNIACEQGRFSALAAVIRAERT